MVSAADQECLTCPLPDCDEGNPNCAVVAGLRERKRAADRARPVDREKAAAASKRYRINNLEKVKARQRAWYQRKKAAANG